MAEVVISEECCVIVWIFHYKCGGRGLCQGGPSSSNHPCHPLNTRNFDLLGYEYNVLSNVATAGLNSVMAALPARDVEEVAALPQRVLDFISTWMAFTDEKGTYLKNAGPILPNPKIPDNEWLTSDSTKARFGFLDGWHAAADDGKSGYVFLFNPTFTVRKLTLGVGEQIGFGLWPRKRTSSGRSETGGRKWVVTTLYPKEPEDEPGVVEAEEEDSRAVLGSGPRKRQVVLDNGRMGGIMRNEQFFSVTIGGQQAVVLSVELTSNAAKSHDYTSSATTSSAVCDATLPHGGLVYRGMPISKASTQQVVDGWVNTTLCVSSLMKQQLADRTKEYPVPWTDRDRNATWLDPARLLVSIYYDQPQLDQPPLVLIEGEQTPALLASASAPRSSNAKSQSTFMGWFLDVSGRNTDRIYQISVRLPAEARGNNSFQGLFYENLEGLAPGTGVVEEAHVSSELFRVDAGNADQERQSLLMEEDEIATLYV